MRRVLSMSSCTRVTGALAASTLIASATDALAGGFEVREQSAYFQGMSFAGSAAGGSLSSMFWNPAAAGEVGSGFTFDSSFTLILPDSEITVDGFTGGIPVGADVDVEIGKDALVPASYAAWRYDSRTVFSLSINSQFGLGTEPDNPNWIGQVHARTAKLFSVNATPTVSYDIAPGVTVAGGVQFQYIDLKRFRAAVPVGGQPFPSSTIEGDDELGVGFTAGLLWKPVRGTSIGVGFRSSIEHDLEGSVSALGAQSPVHADLELPEKVTLSLRQDIAPNLRALGTVEWTNWSRLGVIPIVLESNFLGTPSGAPVANLDFQWHDGWFFALGAEYDWSPKVTLRTGLAYEISPIQNASERLIQLPDADRWWASLGGSYKYSDTISVDFGYTHIFVEDADIDRLPSSTNPGFNFLRLTGSAESSVDIISVGLKTKW